MQNLILGLLVGSVFFTAPQVLASTQKLQAVPIPDEARLNVIAVDLIQNGHRLSVASLEQASSIEEALAFYRNVWSAPLEEGIPGYIEESAGDWSIISRPGEGWHQVVQLRDTDTGLEWRISVMEYEPVTGDALNIAMPSGASLLSSTKARDVGTESTTFVVVSRSGVQTVSDFYRRHFDDEGWSRTSDKALADAQVLMVQRQGERAELVVSRTENGGSLIVINKVMDRG